MNDFAYIFAVLQGHILDRREKEELMNDFAYTITCMDSDSLLEALCHCEREKVGLQFLLGLVEDSKRLQELNAELQACIEASAAIRDEMMNRLMNRLEGGNRGFQ